MKIKAYGWSIVAGLLLMASISAVSQSSVQERFERFGGAITFEGQINAYSPQTAPTGTNGPYEIRGPWSLMLKRDRGSEHVRVLGGGQHGTVRRLGFDDQQEQPDSRLIRAPEMRIPTTLR